MSTNTIRCPGCLAKLADKRPAGPIKVRPGVAVILLAVGAKLTCQCGWVTVVDWPEPEDQRAA